MGNHLDCIHIPFLFPAGMKLPVFFKKHLSSPDGFLCRSVNFGEFKRTKNSIEIIGTFNFFTKNGPTEIPSIGTCSVGCKNWRKKLLAKDLIRTLKKAMNRSASISLFFCSSLGKFSKSKEDENMKLFADFCIENKVLVLKFDNKETKVKHGNKKKFKLIPYCPGLPSPEDININLTCIIIELDTINKISNNNSD
jgi:hypothetical protein